MSGNDKNIHMSDAQVRSMIKGIVTGVIDEAVRMEYPNMMVIPINECDRDVWLHSYCVSIGVLGCENRVYKVYADTEEQSLGILSEWAERNRPEIFSDGKSPERYIWVDGRSDGAKGVHKFDADTTRINTIY